MAVGWSFAAAPARHSRKGKLTDRAGLVDEFIVPAWPEISGGWPDLPGGLFPPWNQEENGIDGSCTLPARVFWPAGRSEDVKTRRFPLNRRTTFHAQKQPVGPENLAKPFMPTTSTPPLYEASMVPALHRIQDEF